MPPLQAPKISFLEIYYYSKTHIKTNDMGLIAFCLNHIIPKLELDSKRNDNIDFTTFGDGNYSISEHDTGFTWVDGRKIYKKTINIGTLPNNETISVPHGISNLARIIKIEGNALRPSDGGMFPLPYVSGTEGLSIYVSAGYTELFIGTGSDRTNMNGYITVYYVKSS